MNETSAQGWCSGKTQRDGMEREAGGGIGMENTCKSMANSCQCMAKTTTIKKKIYSFKKERKKKAQWMYNGCYYLCVSMPMCVCVV